MGFDVNKIQRLDDTDANFEIELSAVLNRDQPHNLDIDADVAAIIRRVREEGDVALFEYTQKFDRFTLSVDNIEISQQQLKQAVDAIPSEQREALRYAAQRVRDFCS